MCLADLHEGALEFLPAHIKPLDDAAIDECGRDHPVAVFLSGFMEYEQDRPLDFGESITNIGDIGIPLGNHGHIINDVESSFGETCKLFLLQCT
jgi:hypothetical protein